MFKSAVEILIKSLDDDGKNYFENFVTNFLDISDVSFKKIFDVEKNSFERKERKKTFDVKVSQKIKKKKKKKKSQVVMKTLEDCNKIQYISKRRKPSFYKKF